jgi:putative transposase
MEARYRDVPELLWERIEPLLPPERPKPDGGRPRNDNRRVMAGILYRLRTGCQWKALPKEYFGSGSTCHERFQEWREAGIFSQVFDLCLNYYDALRGVDWKWCSLDSAMVKAPKGGTTPAPIRPIVRKKGSNGTSLPTGAVFPSP